MRQQQPTTNMQPSAYQPVQYNQIPVNNNMQPQMGQPVQQQQPTINHVSTGNAQSTNQLKGDKKQIKPRTGKRNCTAHRKQPI